MGTTLTLSIIFPVPRQARCKRRSALILRVMKATMAAFIAALRAYPTEALVALCESVQADEGDARCRSRGAAPGAGRACAPCASRANAERYCQGGVALVSRMGGI